MRVVSILLAAGLAAFVNAQSTTTGGDTPTSTQNAADAAVSSAQAEILRCLERCDDDDVNCKAHCITVPSPNGAQANATNDCVRECPQGNGSKADTEAYAECVGRCIGENYYTASIGTPEPTSGPGSGNNNNNNNNNNNDDDDDDDNDNDNDNDEGDDDSSPSGTSGNGASSTGGPSSTTSPDAAVAFGASSGLIGAAGFLAALFAL